MGIYTRSILLILGLIFISPVTGNSQKKKKKKKSKEPVEQPVKLIVNEWDSVSYALGMGVSKNIMASGLDSINYDAFYEGFKSYFKGDSTRLSEESVQPLLSNYFGAIAQKRLEANKKEGEAFLATNKDREGVTTTQSGLQIEVVREGEGESPAANSNVTVHYTGKLLDGTVFDSSVERGEPATFNLGQVIPGWTEGLQLMKPGGKYLLYIPSDLAYGANGAGADIPPHATLIFEVELISINPQ